MNSYFFSLDQSARMLWFSRQKCAYFMIFATKERVCCDFWDKSAYFVIFATKMRVCCDFHDNNCVFGISGSNSCISQVFSAHTCTIHWNGLVDESTSNKCLSKYFEASKCSKDLFGIITGLTPLAGRAPQAWPYLISGSWGSSSTKPLISYLVNMGGGIKEILTFTFLWTPQ